MLAFVFEHLPKDDKAWLVPDILDLRGVLGEVLGFVKLQALQHHVHATDAICKVVGFTGSGPVIGKPSTSQGVATPSPKICVSLFCVRKSPKSRPPLRVYFPFRQSR